MTKEELFERLDWAQASLQEAIRHAQKVLNDGREMLVMDDADWLCSAIENADEARHCIISRGPFPRLMKEVDYGGN
jgi:hypothetical protein